MESGLDDNAAELAAEMERLVSDLMMRPEREQVALEIGGKVFLIFRFPSSSRRVLNACTELFLSKCCNLSMEKARSISGTVQELELPSVLQMGTLKVVEWTQFAMWLHLSTWISSSPFSLLSYSSPSISC